MPGPDPVAKSACERCGAALAQDVAGLCPRCLMSEGMGLAALSGVRPGDFLPPEPGDLELIFPEFEIVELIGRGGMGAVYRAVDRELERTVAIKILPPETASDPEFQERFRQEAAALAKVGHPNIVTLHGAGEREGYFFFVMEFVDGTDLAHRLLGEGRMPVDEVLSIAGQLCAALAYSHSEGVVHRDIKPANILIDGNGGVKVADFGLAKILHSDELPAGGLTRTMTSIGTVQYMAPEQAANLSTDHRADVYAVGAVVYEMLTGVVPAGVFPKPSEKVPGLGRRFDRALLKAMSAEPGARQQSIGELADELQGAGKARVGWYFAGAAVLMMAAGMAWLAFGRGDVEPEFEPETDQAPAEVALLPPNAEPVDKPGLLARTPLSGLAQRMLGVNRLMPLAPEPTFDRPGFLHASGRVSPSMASIYAVDGVLSGEVGLFSAAVLPDGKLRTWGSIGVPPDLPPVAAVEAGARHLVVQHRDGTVSVLGQGELAPSGLVDVARVAAGGGASFALGADGRLVAWGEGAAVDLPNNLPELKQVAAGESFALGLTAEGEVIGWGDNAEGQRELPAETGAGVRAIAAGAAHALALLGDGSVVAWGRDSAGQCEVPALRSKARRVYAGGDGSALLPADGRLYAWGDLPDDFSAPLMPVMAARPGAQGWVLIGLPEGK